MLVKMAYRLAQLYWFTVRPVTLGVRVLMVSDEKVLLVRHSYQQAWFLPGGGVKRGETVPITSSQAVCGEIRSSRSNKAGKIENLYPPGRFRHIMSKSALFVMFLIALVASACQGESRAPATGPADRTPVVLTRTPVPTNTAPPTRGATLPPTEELAAARCTVVSSLSAASAESPYPPVGEGDWTRGPASAAVTIIEYSDFQ